MKARPNFPGDDMAVLCAAVERSVEEFRALRRRQKSAERPNFAHSFDISYLFGDSHHRAAAALRRAADAGLVARTQSRYGPAWKLTRKGAALAQEGELLCPDCAAAPSLADKAAKGCCAACAAGRADDSAERAAESADHWRKVADEHDAAATKHRAAAERFRALAEPEQAAA